MRSWIIGAVSAVIVCGWLPVLPPASVPLGLLLFTILAIFQFGWRASGLAGAAFGFALAYSHGSQILERRLDSGCEMQPQIVRGTVASLPRTSNIREDLRRQRFEFAVAEFFDDSCAGPKTLLLSYYGRKNIAPGDTLQLSAKLHQPWGLANPGSFNMQAWFAESGIDAVGTAGSLEPYALATGDVPFTGHHRLRLEISRAISANGFEPGVDAILRAITVADRSGLNASLWQLLQSYGVNHLVVISGLHIGLIGGLGYLLGSLLSRLVSLLSCHRLFSLLPEVCALVFALCYTSLAGFGLASQRALCMLACFCLASSVGRASSAWNNLLLAAVIVLAVNPLSALGSGFWLSFGAVACLLWLGMWRPQRSLPARLLMTHGYMSIAMVPLGGYWFGTASVVAGLANLVLVPLVTLILVPLTLMAAFLHVLGVGAADTLWHWAAVFIGLFLAPAQSIAEDHRDWLTILFYPQWPELLLAVTGLALLALPLGRAAAILVIALLLPLFLVDRKPPLAEPTLSVLDVGQGSAVVFQSGARTLVYDTGGGDPAGNNLAASVVLPFLRYFGVKELDTLIASHPDNDHSAGINTVLGQMPVARYLYGLPVPGVTGGRPCVAGKSWQWPTGERFQLLAPAGESGLTSNNASCVLLIEVRGVRLLLPGDVEASREKQLLAYWGATLDSDVLLAGHHGSRTSSTYGWLKYITPDTVVFSYGYANRFGHPHATILARTRVMGAKTHSTASDGAVILTFRPDGTVSGQLWRPTQQRYWM
ncbi:MAG: DNA internalization-related competence protein ComEC/Rec2 [Halioglobus sp.]